MASIGDTIDLLSTTTPLTAGATWTSTAVVLGQYNSLVVMVKTDIDSTLYVDWSGDNGLNWDGVDNHSIIDNVSKRIVITTQQKMIRLRLENGALNQTYLRLFTYGVVTNNSSIVSLTDTINIENIISSLKGGQTVVTDIVPLINYDFKYGTITTCQANDLVCCYPDIWTGANNSNPTCGINYQRSLYLNAGTTATSYGIIMGRGIYSHSSSTYYTRLTATFNVSNTPNSTLIVGNAPTTLVTALTCPTSISKIVGAFGWYQSAVVKTNNNFSVIFYDLSSGVTSIPRTSWLDKCDGNGELPIIDFTDSTKENTFQISFIPGGNIVFSILNPTTNKFIKIYQKTYLNNQNPLFLGEQSLLMYSIQNGVVSSGNDVVSLNSFSISSDMSMVIPTSLTGVSTFSVGLTGVTNNFGAIRQSTTVASQFAFIPFYWYDLSVSTNGANAVTLSIYLDSTVAGGSWNIDPNYPIEINTTGTVTQSNKLIYQYQIAPTDTFYIKMNPNMPLLYGFRILGLQLTSKTASDVYIKIGYCT